jgi:hypothetical protein
MELWEPGGIDSMTQTSAPPRVGVNVPARTGLSALPLALGPLSCRKFRGQSEVSTNEAPTEAALRFWVKLNLLGL